MKIFTANQFDVLVKNNVFNRLNKILNKLMEKEKNTTEFEILLPSVFDNLKVKNSPVETYNFYILKKTDKTNVVMLVVYELNSDQMIISTKEELSSEKLNEFIKNM